MQHNDDSSVSGYINDAFKDISQVFTDVEILSTSEVNVVAKAKRCGRWWLLKGLRQENDEGLGKLSVANTLIKGERLRLTWLQEIRCVF